MATILELLEKELEIDKANGNAPEWITIESYQLLRDKYLDKGQTIKDRYLAIASTAAKHTQDPAYWAHAFFEIMWKGWLACSTPVMANMGTNKGMPVSCSGSYIGDSIDEIYTSKHTTAMLTKNGFGTSGFLGDIRSRGSHISGGGTALGVVDVIKGFINDMRYVSQGNTRRGAWAGYVPMSHGDSDELIKFIENYPDDLNIGWNVYDSDIEKLDNGDPKSLEFFQKSLKAKAVTGKGYYFFPDKVNRMNPQMYKDNDLKVLASNLCTEINLFSKPGYDFTCVLSSMNLAKYDEWKATNAVYNATIFLDCVAQEFIEMAGGIPGMEGAVRFTEETRAIGLGTLGFHTYLQDNMIAFETFPAHMKNLEIFTHMEKESLRASQWMAETWGEPELCKGYGVRNTHRLAIAPNTSSALIVGGVSQGIEPVVANSFIQTTSAGEISRLNPSFVAFAKSKGVELTKGIIKTINENNGSVQHLDWLNEHEKLVFKTAYEIDQEAIIRLASARQPRICQGQSLNLFFYADAPEEYIAKIHKIAFKDPNIKQLYYMRTLAGVKGSTGESSVCLACEG